MAKSTQSPTLSHRHQFETLLSFYVDASFDRNKRKWYWSDGNEIQNDQWIFQCNQRPHEPATEYVITIVFKEIFSK